MNEFLGNSIDTIISREEAAEQLGISTSVLHTLLNIVSLYVPRFKRLRTRDNTGVSRKRPLTNWDIEPLKKVLHTYRLHGKIQTRVLVSQDPDSYN